MKLTDHKTKLKNILIVDDEDSVRQLMTLILKAEGYNVLEAVHGIDALDKINMTKIDMVITDLSMPRMDGISFTKALRNRPDSRFIPVVLMATRFRGHLKSEGDEAGVNEWILKPLLHQQLADTVNRYSA